MARDVRANYRKRTAYGEFNLNTVGRLMVTNYAGHASWHSVALHVSLNDEPDRPVTITLSESDIRAIEELISTHRRLEPEWHKPTNDPGRK